jgi:hypothetical protein
VAHLFDRWRALAPGETLVLVRLAILLPAVSVALKVLGIGRTYRALVGRCGRLLDDDISADERTRARRLAYLIGVAARRGPFRARCLEQSLMLTWLLHRRRVRAELRIGVANLECRLSAHAWVELAGQVLNDSPSVAAKYAAYRDMTDLLARVSRHP